MNYELGDKMNLKEEFIKLGYTENDYNEIRNSYALMNTKDETISMHLKDIFTFFLECGYTKEEIIKMTKTLPSIYGYSIENMKQKIVDIMELGYTKEEVIKMTKTLPAIYSLSIENMKQKIVDIMELGYTKEEVIKMTKALPSIYGLSIENIKQKIDFYNLIDMHELAVIDAKMLMQSINLSYARYSFYIDLGINIDMNNYRKLFINQKQFEKTYGITKEELLKRYDYNKYKEEVEKKRG